MDIPIPRVRPGGFKQHSGAHMKTRLICLVVMAVVAAAGDSVSELYGPFVETGWDQSGPYNLLCPSTSGSSHAPVGTAPAAFAQIMNVHRWPPHGAGSHSYTDSSGSTTGSFSADFSDTYDWGNMLLSYSSSDPQVNQDAIAELMFELGVAVEVDYEASWTTADSSDPGAFLDDYFFFEEAETHSSQAALVAAMEADLRAGFPCVFSTTHYTAIVDGLRVDGDETTYHINYGTGGYGDGWETVDEMFEDTLQCGVTSIRPRLMAFPETNALCGEAGGSVELQWILPKRLEGEVAQLEIMSFNDQTTSWESFAVDTVLASRRYEETTTLWDDCDDYTVFKRTSTCSWYKNWAVSTSSGVDACFYKQPGGYTSYEYHLTSRSTITPTSTTQLILYAKYNLRTDPFRVLVSTDRTDFEEVWSTTATADWGDISIDLSAYAGQAIYVRLEYITGDGIYYYTDGSGGVWIDSISLLEVSNPELEGQPVHYTTLTGLAAGDYTLAAVLTDTNSVAHEIGPSVTLTVTADANDTDADGLPNDWELLYYGGETNANPAAMAANEVNTVMAAYITGIDPTDPDALFEAALTDGSALRWTATSGRVYSVWSTTNLLESFQPLETNILWPQAGWTDTVPRVESFYRIDVEIQQ
jgi:hypothetical protein